ncbi:MAG TPA: OmpA family protein [Gemmatimonadales bacterium]|nr:OmpA family protein [Gemmatimonadales bacterium]
MLKRMFGLTAAALLGVARLATAQSGGSIEAGLLGRYNWFDNASDLANKGGLGARLGVFFNKNWELEAQGAYADTRSSTASSVQYIPVTGRLQYNIWKKSTGWVFGLGYTYNQFKNDIEANQSGAQGLVGFRFGTGDLFSLRADFTLDYIPSGFNFGGTGTRANWHPGIQLGLSLITGTNPDHDRDGVKDKADKCPATPAGEPVDAEGCAASQRDTDGDGVKDNIDKCPNSPAGSAVDATGCPPDADGDKVVDSADKCPDTPAGEAVDANGCSASQKDSDGDKVTDNLDKCPSTPAGTAVDASGCPLDSDNDKVLDARDKCPDTPAGEPVDANGCSASQRDSDGDGVPDSRDKCPNTAAGSRVDAYGCNVVLFQGAMKALVLEGVSFETGKAALTTSSSDALDRVAAGLAEYQNLTIEIGGHTDNTGSRPTNIKLSKARADAVKAYLVSRGIAASRMTTKGYGPDAPIADNKSADGRSRNRRVELKKTSS